MASDAIVFRDVRKSYRSRRGEIEALKGISFSVKSGEIFGFAGPNGAGKSTAIKILVGLLSADSGECEAFSKACGSTEAKRLLGYLPEVTLYHEFLTAEELLRIHAGLAGLKGEQVDKRCKAALERVGLGDRQKSRLKEFSKGMKQRFGIAQAIVGEPKLLILDELTSGLDPQAQASLLDLLGELREQGLTIFFSSHHLAEIEKVCDSVCILHHGEVKAFGTLNDVLGEEQQLRVEVHLKSGESPDTGDTWKQESTGHFVAYLGETETGNAIRALGEKLETVVSVQPQRRSLESLFLELTTDKKEMAKTL